MKIGVTKGIRPGRDEPRQRVNVRCPQCDVSISTYLDDDAKYPQALICKPCKIVFNSNTGEILATDVPPMEKK